MSLGDSKFRKRSKHLATGMRAKMKIMKKRRDPTMMTDLWFHNVSSPTNDDDDDDDGSKANLLCCCIMARFIPLIPLSQ